MLSAPGTATDTVDYTYDSTWKDLLTEYDGMEMYADAIGNPQEYTHDREFIWRGRELIYITELGQDDFVECRYNENGLRSFKCLYDGNDPAATYHYFWSDDNRLLGYVLDDGDANTDNVQMSVLYDTDSAPIGFTVDDHTYYYIKNIQGDVLCVTDETGTPLANYVYDAWGNFALSPASQTVSNQDLAFISAYNPVTYRGYLYDPELGFYYLQSRYYDPETCRFLNADAVIDSGKSALGANRFSYCYSSPVVMVDSDGNKPILFFSKYGVDINLMEEAEEYSKYQIEGVVSTYSIIPPLPISEMPIFRNNIKINTIEYVVQLFLEMEKAMENDTEEEAENKFIQNCSYWHAFIQQSNYVRLLMKGIMKAYNDRFGTAMPGRSLTGLELEFYVHLYGYYFTIGGKTNRPRFATVDFETDYTPPSGFNQLTVFELPPVIGLMRHSFIFSLHRAILINKEDFLCSIIIENL